jgi:hypothetical protein
MEGTASGGAAKGRPSPDPSPHKLRAGRGEFERAPVSATRGARPLRARITRPPPPKLLGEVGGADGSWLGDRDLTASAGALTRLVPRLPSPASGRGDKLHLRLENRCRSPSPVQFAGEGRGGGRSRAPDGCPSKSPDPSVGPNLPRRFRGRWASNASPEGAPRTKSSPPAGSSAGGLFGSGRRVEAPTPPRPERRRRGRGASPPLPPRGAARWAWPGSSRTRPAPRAGGPRPWRGR